MKKLEKHLAQHPFTVMVSLPKNDPALAKAAIAGGADEAQGRAAAATEGGVVGIIALTGWTVHGGPLSAKSRNTPIVLERPAVVKYGERMIPICREE